MCCTGSGCPSWECEKSGDAYDWVWCPWPKDKWTCCFLGNCNSYCYSPGGTCAWCVGDDDGGNGGEGGGCNWDTKPNVAPTSCVQANGLWGHYYRDNPVGEPRFDGGLKKERNDSQVNFDWGSGSPDGNLCSDNFSAYWTGYVNLSSSGNWRFGATSDDGFAVDLETTPGNWTRVFSDWSDHAARTQWGNWYSLNAGWYGIRVWYYENGGSAVAQLRFQGPGTAPQIVPSANLQTCSSPSGTVQGQKVLMPDNTPSDPISGYAVYLDGGSATTANPYTYSGVSVGSHTVSVATGGYLVQSTLCYNRTDCHTQACLDGSPSCPVPGAGATGSSRTVNVPAGGYADLWWHYTKVDPWLQVLNGDVHANHMTSLRAAPVGSNARWLISARGSVTGTSQENWRAQYYPERNFNLTQNTPIKAPTYADLWKRFGEGKAATYAGPTLPNSPGAFLISGSKTVNGVFNQAGGVNTLVFVNGDLTIDAEIRTAADSTLAFIVSGSIRFSKDFAGGGPADDFAGGIYVAQGAINTAFDKAAPDEITRQLAIEGALISLTNTILLNRNLSLADNKTTPAEIIDLSAKYYPLLKSVLGRPKFFYREVPAGF